MCGIAGIASVDGAIQSDLVRRMGDSLQHRGPDQRGYREHLKGGLAVGLAARRLAILDLSPAGDQPMETPDGSEALAYNGEIYNEPVLRASLQARGYRFRSSADTETVLNGYAAEGLDFLRRLNGMFALAIHDRRQARLVLARDRMGIKPLYYHWDGRRLAFASELRTLLLALPAPALVDRSALELYLALGFVPAPYALIRGIRKVLPGSAVVLDADGGLHEQQFAKLLLGPASRLEPAHAAPVVRDCLRQAVRRQMRSDVPVGVLLSGGIDSTIVATCAAACTDTPLQTFSISFRTERSPVQDFYNADAQFARRLAHILGTQHREVELDEQDDFPELITHLAAGIDEPVWELSFVSIYLLSRLARQHGVKVLLTGDGGDELFAGYPWLAGAWRQEQYERAPLLRELLPLVQRLVPAESTLSQHVANLKGSIGQPDARRYELTHAIFDRTERAALLGSSLPREEDPLSELIAPLISAGLGRARADRLALLDLALWARDHFNQRLDRMTSLTSVEARVPMQDDEVVDLALGLSVWSQTRGLWPKKLLKDAFRDEIPDFVLERPKRPFAAPIWAWSVGALREFIQAVLAPERVASVGLVDPREASRTLEATELARQDRRTFQLWTLVMLQLWAEQVLRGERAVGAREQECEGARVRGSEGPS